MNQPVPAPPPVSTTELDWAEQARRDGWRLADGIWQHDERTDAYDDDEWVYLGDGVWEDAVVTSLTPTERRQTLTGYSQLQDELRETPR